MGRRTGYRMTELAGLGLAALLMDVGYILLPRELVDAPEPLSDEERLETQKTRSTAHSSWASTGSSGRR